MVTKKHKNHAKTANSDKLLQTGSSLLKAAALSAIRPILLNTPFINRILMTNDAIITFLFLHWTQSQVLIRLHDSLNWTPCCSEVVLINNCSL